MSKRSCGDCTKCCEGWLSGEALGKKFSLGKPCHFIAIGKGCTIYSQRPKDPCVAYRCGWLSNADLPEWMKPNEVNAIVGFNKVNDIEFMQVLEAGEVLSSKVLTWLIQYAITNQLNFVWQVEGGFNWMGSTQFHLLMKDQYFPISKSLDSKSKNLLPVVEVE
jgi:hypothetical protein